MERRRLAIFLLSVVLAGLAALTGLVGGLDTGLLFLTPALFLLLPLAAGLYLGERRIARWASSRRRPRRRPASEPVPRCAWEDGLGSAGLLLARRLAGRAPPSMVVAGA